jgi:hypothetical protein
MARDNCCNLSESVNRKINSNKLQPLIKNEELAKRELPIEFPWPKGCLHVIGLLQDGFANRKDVMPEHIQRIAGSIVSLATLLGIISDRIWSLDVAGIIPPKALLETIRPAINDKSYFLSEIAYRQVSKLEHIPDDINIWIKKAILKRMLSNGIIKQNHVVFAQVSRLINSNDYIAVIRGIQVGYLIEIITSVIAGITMFLFVLGSSYSGSPVSLEISGYLFNISIGLLVIFSPFLISTEVKMLPSYMFAVVARTVVLIGGALISFFVMKSNLFILYVFLAYFSIVMPLLLLSIDNIPFEKGVFLGIFSPIFATSHYLRKIVDALRHISFERNKYGLIVLIMFIGIWGFVGNRVVQNRIAMDRLAIVVLIIMMLLYAFIGLKIYGTFREDRKDKLIWQNWINNEHREMNADEMISELASFSWRNATKYIKVIRKNNLLLPSLESIASIKQLIRIIEAPSVKNDLSNTVQHLLEVTGDNRYTSELLDELFQLLEQTRAKIHA